MAEGLSMVLMNSFKKNSGKQATVIIDKNYNIIEANHNFFSLFSTVIKNNKLLLNMAMNQKSISINNKNLTITQVAEFYVIHAAMDKQRELTKQEHKIMMLLATGETNKIMAEKLKLSPSTINNHLTHIFNKFDVNSRLSAVKEWKKYGKQ